MPFQPGFRGRAPLTLAFFASATATGASPATLTYPGSILAGDLIFLGNFGRNNAGGSAQVSPAGYTGIFDQDTLSNTRAYLGVKIAAGGETTPSLTTGGVENNKFVVVFRPNRPIQSVTIASTHIEQTDSAPAGQTITSASGVPPLVALAGYRSSAAVSSRGFSPAADAEISPSTLAYVKYKIFNGAGADESISMADDGNSNSLWSLYASCLG